MALTRQDVDIGDGAWRLPQSIRPATYVCGFCGDKVGSDEGYRAGSSADGTGSLVGCVRICPSCKGPTAFTASGKQVPCSPPASPVPNVPNDLSQLYNEARSSAGAGAHTAAVLACRKMLMNIAVQEGAEEGKPFIDYVKYLADNNYVPPKGKAWVDYIRKRGNEANHEIQLMQEQDAIALITFVEMLLRFIYEFPEMVPGAREEKEAEVQQ